MTSQFKELEGAEGSNVGLAMSGKVKEALLAYAFLLPSAVILGVFSFFPLGKLIWSSFQKKDRFGRTSEYVGGENWGNVTGDAEFWGHPEFFGLWPDGEGLVWQTIQYVLYTVPLGLFFGTLLAVAANRKIRGIKFFHTAYSSTVATSVAVASVVFLILLNEQVGYLADSWAAQAFNLGDPDTALRGVSLSVVWQNLGLTFVIVLAGLQAVPEDLMEAARLDGYNAMQRFWRITMPLISPTLLFLVVILVVLSLQVFAPVELLTEGGPAGSSENLVYRIFQDAQQPNKLGEASVMALVLFGLTVIVSLVQFGLLSRRVHYGN